MFQVNSNPEWPQYRVLGWAPGNYACMCYICGEAYTGDKRSSVCYPCADKLKKRPLHEDRGWQPN